MKKQDLDALAGLYEGLYSPADSGEYLSEEYLEEQGGRGSSSASQTNQSISGAQLLYGPSGKPQSPSSRPTNLRGGGTRPARPTAAPTQSRFAGARDAAFAKARQIKGSPVVGPKPTERPAATAPAARPATPGAGAPATAKVAPTAAVKPAGQTGDKAKDTATWAKANPTLANKPKTPNPLMQRTFGYQTGNAPDQIKAASAGGDPAKAAASFARSKETANKLGLSGSVKALTSGYEWGTKATLKDVADAYASIYEGKKKDQDQDGDEDFADVMIARMMASGMSRAEAIAAVRNKEYNEEYELDEATRMRKELGKEGETRVRGELAARSRAYKRSGSVDKTIAAAERGADRPYIKHKRDESDADRKKREDKQSRTLRGLASSRRGSVRDNPRAGMRGYAAKVEGSDKDLQTARQRAMSAGTLTPKEKKQLGEAYQIYEIVASYLLENNFAETLNDANVIIENMSENWLEEILIEKSGEQPLPYGRMMKKSNELADSDDPKKQKRAAEIYLAANAPKGPKVKKKN